MNITGYVKDSAWHGVVDGYETWFYPFPRCATAPEGWRGLGGDWGERCADGCLSVERAWRLANPRLRFDLSDSDAMSCYRCGRPVCVGCQAAAVESTLEFCDRCGAAADQYFDDMWPESDPDPAER